MFQTIGNEGAQCGWQACERAIMATEEDDPSRPLTVEECRLLADAFSEDSVTLPDGTKKEEMLKLADGYRRLAKMKGFIGRKAN
jgi:hypothetical protein